CARDAFGGGVDFW
nr:immunoglobulin heavy chain junction region [Macaca mulatta]MOV46691.1 immunoglobulin heavy chain junction region [Macaca mulatta]